ncbi:uncharacterized protein [Panulirus ornatus]|uniref:uncharacterized protein n=1 Tax=Panulirus ornatus TaxID=150431 RepID=UPI003A8537B4
MIRMTSEGWWKLLVTAALVSAVTSVIMEGPVVTRPATAEDHLPQATTVGDDTPSGPVVTRPATAEDHLPQATTVGDHKSSGPVVTRPATAEDHLPQTTYVGDDTPLGLVVTRPATFEDHLPQTTYVGDDTSLGPVVTQPTTAEDHPPQTTTVGDDTQPELTTLTPVLGGVQHDEPHIPTETAKIDDTTGEAGGGGGGEEAVGLAIAESQLTGGEEEIGGENKVQTTTESQSADDAAEEGEGIGGDSKVQTTTENQPTDDAKQGGGEESGGDSKVQTTTESQPQDDATEGGGEQGGGEGGDGNSSTTATTVDLTTVTTSVPSVMTTTEMTQTTEVNCGVNADLVEGECVCATNWTHDPADPGTHCPCPDLCRGSGVMTCPPEGSCYHMTCHVVSCTCPGHLRFDPFTKACKSPCQYYGDALCGLGSNMKCEDADAEEGGFVCKCDDGFVLAGDSCQDVDECQEEAGGSSPCRQHERCVNTEGGHTCPCQEGFLRSASGSCTNVNECLNPALHDCGHICHDADPPVMYTCDCYPGYAWDNVQRRCVLKDETTACECSEPGKSICYKPEEGQQECNPRPGYKMKNNTFYDVAECEDEASVRSWCWENGVCVEGEGGSRCVCQEGYTNNTENYGLCVAIECPAGTRISGSVCVDACTTITCPPPLTCALTTAGEPECRCQSACQSLLHANVSTSVYHGSFLAATHSRDSDIAHRVKIANNSASSTGNLIGLYLFTPAAIECPAGTRISGSVCVDACTTITCPPPLTCALTTAGEPECRCQSACQSLLHANVSTSVYHGSFLAATHSRDSDIAHRVKIALETYFGRDTVEVVSIEPQQTRKRSVSRRTNVQIQFLLTTSQANMTQELTEIIMKQCEASQVIPDTCILPGGLVVLKDSITIEDIDPCAGDPCPGGDIFVCSPRTNASGRFTCSCKPGFHKDDAQGILGFCQDVDECEDEEACDEDHDCLNTPGSYVCRLKPQLLTADGKVVREMAIAFGVLFFLTFFVTVALIYWLMKKSKSNRELVPMSTTSGFDNEAYHR